MKLGFFVTNQYLPGESMPQKIQDSAEQVRAARDAGFSLIATGQHYLAMRLNPASRAALTCWLM